MISSAMVETQHKVLKSSNSKQYITSRAISVESIFIFSRSRSAFILGFVSKLVRAVLMLAGSVSFLRFL